MRKSVIVYVFNFLLIFSNGQRAFGANPFDPNCLQFLIKSNEESESPPVAIKPRKIKPNLLKTQLIDKSVAQLNSRTVCDVCSNPNLAHAYSNFFGEDNVAPQVLLVWASENPSDLPTRGAIVDASNKMDLRTIGNLNFTKTVQLEGSDQPVTIIGVVLEGARYNLSKFIQAQKNLKFVLVLNYSNSAKYFYYSNASEKWIQFQESIKSLRAILTTYALSGGRAEFAHLQTILTEIIRDPSFKEALIEELGSDLTQFDIHRQLLGVIFVRNYVPFKKILSKLLPKKVDDEVQGLKLRMRLSTYAKEPISRSLPLSGEGGNKVFLYPNVLLQWREIDTDKTQAIIRFTRIVTAVLNGDVQASATTHPNIFYVNGTTTQLEMFKGRSRDYRIYYVNLGSRILILEIVSKERCRDQATWQEILNRYKQAIED